MEAREADGGDHFARPGGRLRQGTHHAHRERVPRGGVHRDRAEATTTTMTVRGRHHTASGLNITLPSVLGRHLATVEREDEDDGTKGCMLFSISNGISCGGGGLPRSTACWQLGTYAHGTRRWDA